MIIPKNATMPLIIAVSMFPMPEIIAIMTLPMVRKMASKQDTTAPIVKSVYELM